MDTWDRWRAVEAARLHYQEGLPFTAIADRLELTRFRVGRLVATARSEGWVQISITSPPGVDAGLTRALGQFCRDLGIRRVLVTPEEGGRDAMNHAAAEAIEETTMAGDVLGLACGTTVNRVVAAIRRLPACSVVQLTGLTAPGEVADSSVETIRRAARLSSSEVRPVYEPMVQPRRDVAAQRANHPSLRHAFARWDHLTGALITIGAWEAGLSNVFDALDDPARRRAARGGAVAEFCGHLVDAEGRKVAPEITARCLTVPLDRLRGAREVTAVAAAPERTPAVRAALRARLIHTLVATEPVARVLLAED